MVVPYGDPSPTVFCKNAFDVGEHGSGPLTDSLELGCDCLGEIRYLDVSLADTHGRLTTLRNAICLHEEDDGMLWKHLDLADRARSRSRRSRRMVISSIATVGNYEYGFYWYLYQDGTIQSEVKLTGIVHTRGLAPGEEPAHGTVVAPLVSAPVPPALLQHATRHDRRRRSELRLRGADHGRRARARATRYGNAFHAEERLLRTELEARRSIDRAASPLLARREPGRPQRPRAAGRLRPGARRQRAGVRRARLELPSASRVRRAPPVGDAVRPGRTLRRRCIPNGHPGGDGLPAWTAADRSIEATDVVLWYTFGAHHVPRPEDWPVMPVVKIGFALRPVASSIEAPRSMSLHHPAITAPREKVTMKRRRKEPPSTPFDANGPRRTVSATPTVTPSEDWPQTFEQIQSRTFDRTFAGYDRSQLQLFLTVAADLIDSLERDRPVPKEFTMAESYSDQI